MATKPQGKIYLIPSEIWIGTGREHLPDATVKVFSQIGLFLVENIRTSRRFISSMKLDLQIEDLQFELLDRKTSNDKLSQYLAAADKGINIAVMSEAGCPGIADPGTLLVARAHQKRLEVIPMVGPSSFTMALMASGLAGQQFTFNGYLPIKRGDRIKKIKKLESRIFRDNESQIFMETPYRNEGLLQILTEVCNKQLFLTVARGLNGPNQSILTLPVSEWKTTSIDLRKIPTVFILGKDPFLKKGSKFAKN